MDSKFKEIGNYLIQIGLYLSTTNVEEFEERKQIKDNAISFLMQAYLYLQSYKELPTLENDSHKEKVEEYLSRKQVIEIYHPLFTEYGLTQSIHTKGLPHIKRGSKYFFKKSEIDKWLEENGNNSVNKTIKFV